MRKSNYDNVTSEQIEKFKPLACKMSMSFNKCLAVDRFDELFSVSLTAIADAIIDHDSSKVSLMSYITFKIKCRIIEFLRDNIGARAKRKHNNLETFYIHDLGADYGRLDDKDLRASEALEELKKQIDPRVIDALLMRLNGYTQKEIAEKFGCSEPNITYIIRSGFVGNEPAYDRVMKIMKRSCV